ncbi:MAG: TenA family protein [Propionibacteriaceae bacterium]|nr:TenA family protein [Propionibacteriaceae bacterium]
MTITWTTGEFSGKAWEATAEIRRRIDELPLLVELADGSLDVNRFVEYLVQDDFYLRGYTRALAMLATRAPSPEAAGFWAGSASGAVAAEVEMHAGLMSDPALAGAPRPTVASPTTRAYVNMLQTMTAYEPYEVGVAAVLPCYWVYADVGARLAETASAVKDHPFGNWAAAYADPVFQNETRRAIELLDEAAAAVDDATRERMLTAFIDATYYEEQFWAKSYDQETWSV